MVYIRTCAYNAEKTLKRAVDSVLNQTYQEFEYHILDNGSTDHTRTLIQNYARKDKRIKPYYSQTNFSFQENQGFWNLSKKIPTDSYFCILDADDAYFSTFFEEMLSFMQNNSLELAACGTIFVDSDGHTLGGRLLEKDVIINTPDSLNFYFPTIHWNLRQVWGKLYSAKAAAVRVETEMPDWYPKAYGGDTANVMECAKAAKCFGVYAKVLHSYTISNKSVSHQWIPGRVESDVILHERAIDFLVQLCGKVSERNLSFLYVVYFNALNDTLRVLFHAWLPLQEKLANLGKMLSNSVTKEMFAANMTVFGTTENNKLEFLRNILQWLEDQRDAYTAVCVPALAEVYRQLNPDFSQLIAEEHLLWYLKRTPKTVSYLAGQDYQAVLQQLDSLLSTDCSQVFPVVLAQMVSALLQNQAEYLYYSKYFIELLLQSGDYQGAETELTEWERILPEDMDFAAFRTRLTERSVQDE
ncbi:MAG: glycosyltransferase [Oscillospiraceae bacterium]|nr:glycosyltransferase [Oscillospiraceae bacterium]